jgi:predicted nucleic acid-binding protein
MDHLFFDTSALVKRYHEEEGTETVDSLIEEEQNQVVISSLSVIESASAFRRKHNSGELSQDRMNLLLSEFFEEALDEFGIVPLEEPVTEYSFDLILEEDLRTLDSLQLSTALSIDNDGMVFVSADRNLNEVANRRGLRTLDPTEE